MPVDFTFSPPVAPDPGYVINNELRVLEADFGDGYSQRVVDGININREPVDFTWTNLYKVEKDYIDGFLKDRKGAYSFFYTIQDDEEPRVFTCKVWSVERITVDNYTIIAKFKRVYDL